MEVSLTKKIIQNRGEKFKMIKNHNKVILLLVLATLLFSIVLEASATKSFNDVSGNDVQSNAVYKLNKLGIIDGYPDGSFGPDKTITRAEFARIAVNMAGRQAVVEDVKNTDNKFKDVTSEDWFNGYVNAAAGYLKGDPSGNFRPNDNITQAEVITVFLRILGYNDNLPGNGLQTTYAKQLSLISLIGCFLK